MTKVAVNAHVTTLLSRFKSKRDPHEAIAGRPLAGRRAAMVENQARPPIFDVTPTSAPRAGRDWDRDTERIPAFGRTFGNGPEITAGGMDGKRRQIAAGRRHRHRFRAQTGERRPDEGRR